MNERLKYWPVPSWVKSPRCESCIHWTPPSVHTDSYGPLTGQCSIKPVSYFTGNSIFHGFLDTKNTSCCSQWEQVK
jgi:hypothetical protein